MEKNGVVIEKNKEKATVRFLRHEACSRCGGCMTAYTKKDIEVIAKNKINAEIGDYVEVTLEEESFLNVSFIPYMIPFIALVLGFAIGYFLHWAQIAYVFLGLTLMAVSFVMIYFYNQKLIRADNNQYIPVIIGYAKGLDEQE